MKPIARLVLESTARRMSIDGRVLPLTTVEYEILSRLTEAAGSIIAREQLVVEVFERQFNPEDRALDVHIHRLRKKLGTHGWLLVTGTRIWTHAAFAGFEANCDSRSRVGRSASASRLNDAFLSQWS